MAYRPLPSLAPAERSFPRAVTSLAFDPVSDILWTGNEDGVVTTYYTNRGLPGVSFPVCKDIPVTKIVAGDSQVNAFGAGSNGVGSWAKGGNNKWFYRYGTCLVLSKGPLRIFSAPSNVATFSNTYHSSHSIAVSLTSMELLFLNSMTGRNVRQIPTSSLLTHLVYSHSSLLSGSVDGFLRIHDPRTGATRNGGAESLVKAHIGAISGLQATSNFIFSIGMGERSSCLLTS
jgi:hypothetical protein